MDVLPALRDAEGDLAIWRRSPLRPLLERAFAEIDTEDLEEIRDAIQEATSKLSDFDRVETLEENIGHLFTDMSGPRQDIKPRLGFGTTDAIKLYRNIRLLIDEGRRGIADASLGSKNPKPISIPIFRGLSTVGRSTAAMTLSQAEVDDLTRYLDVTRAEILFARGVLLVEGDAERFLVPAFAKTLDTPLDHLGITVCSVAGTNFEPYVKFLTALRIPFAVLTDWDPISGNDGLGANRSRKLVRAIETARPGAVPPAVARALTAQAAQLRQFVAGQGISVNEHTLEVDLFRHGFAAPIIETLREGGFSQTRRNMIDAWEADADDLDTDELLTMVRTDRQGPFCPASCLAHRPDCAA